LPFSSQSNLDQPEFYSTYSLRGTVPSIAD
jgi:hypothetical protein